MNQTRGFTRIELVAVIVILGILAATAVPKFVDLQVEARDAAAKALAGTIGSGASLNYAKRLATSGVSGTAITAATACSALTAAFWAGGLPTDITFATPAATLAGCGASGNVDMTCMVEHSQGTVAGFALSVVCTG